MPPVSRFVSDAIPRRWLKGNSQYARGSSIPERSGHVRSQEIWTGWILRFRNDHPPSMALFPSAKSPR